MAMQNSMADQALISPFNIIFSCVICQKTIADVYPARTVVPDHEIGSLENACKMWITGCCHLTCSEHLEGGGKVCSAIASRC